MHILDNPIWNALNSGNKQLAFGSNNVKFIKRDVGLFAGMKHNGEGQLLELSELLPSKSDIILFTPGEITIPDSWRIKIKRPLLQMIYEQLSVENADFNDIVPLEDENIPAMLELTKMTNPGPFFSRTIDLGYYEGIFDGDKLIAMIGQRLHPANYTEVSAVCTHPDHTGRGHAAKLIIHQLKRMVTTGNIPFLHVYPENPACKLYEKLGFHTRKEMMVYFLQRTM